MQTRRELFLKREHYEEREGKEDYRVRQRHRATYHIPMRRLASDNNGEM